MGRMVRRLISSGQGQVHEAGRIEISALPTHGDMEMWTGRSIDAPATGGVRIVQGASQLHGVRFVAREEHSRNLRELPCRGMRFAIEDPDQIKP